MGLHILKLVKPTRFQYVIGKKLRNRKIFSSFKMADVENIEGVKFHKKTHVKDFL